MSIGAKTLSQVKVYVNGFKLLEDTTVSISRTFGKTRQDTTGGIGYTPGTASIKISFSQAIPLAGFETLIPEGNTIVNYKLTLMCAGKSLTSTGVFLDDSLQYSINGNASISHNFEGSYSDWE